MEQKMVANKSRTPEQDADPLRCPRCGSPDTKFRYFNNHNFAQPRHYCRTCKRQWTVGGNLRNIPVGGKMGNGRPSRASSTSRCNYRSRRLTREEQPQNPNHDASPVVTMLSQNLNATKLQPSLSLPAVGSGILSYTLKEEISFLDAIQSLIEPEINRQCISKYGDDSSNAVVQRERSIRSMQLQQQGLTQQIPWQIQYHPTQDPGNNVQASYSFENTLLQLSWPSPQSTMEKMSFSSSNSVLWNNIASRTSGEDMNTPAINVDEWLNLPFDGPY